MEAKQNDLVIAQAARWFARLRAPDCSESEQAAFTRWRELSVRHAQAYAEAERVAATVSERLVTDSRLRMLADAALAESTGVSSASRWRTAAVLAVCVLTASIATKQFMQTRSTAMSVAIHSNDTKRQQNIVLADGSLVSLDVGSRIEVKMSSAERHVELLAGRAYFVVVHDNARPFFVNAGAMRTVDLGTHFQVELTEKDVSVTLVEGSVAVSDVNTNASWQQTLIPGQQLLLHTDTGARETRNVDASALTSWSHGRLVFKGMPLSEVLNEVNRYAEAKIHLGDDSLATIPIGGNFIAGGDSAQVVDALAAVLPIRVIHVGANEIVLFQRYEAETP